MLPKRWVVERTIGWLNRCRRLAKDWECLNRNGLAFLPWASVRRMVRGAKPQANYGKSILVAVAASVTVPDFRHSGA